MTARRGGGLLEHCADKLIPDLHHLPPLIHVAVAVVVLRADTRTTMVLNSVPYFLRQTSLYGIYDANIP